MFDLPAKDRLALLLDHFARIEDPREPWRVQYPLPEVLLLVTCGTICSCDDYDEIVLWGEQNLDFLRQFSDFHFGIPKEEWLRTLINRLDPRLFEECFLRWAQDLRPDALDIIALDGKTLRRSGDGPMALSPVHMVSAWASSAQLIIAAEPVAAKTNEVAAMLEIIERLPLAGSLVTIDAIATNARVATAITAAGGDYVLALKANQAGLHADARRLFDDPQAPIDDRHESVEKDHGRLETRRTRVSSAVDWLRADRRAPGEPAFAGLRCLIETTTRVEMPGQPPTEQRRYFLSSRALTAERAGQVVRRHWGIESQHWVLDVVFKEDQSRLRRGHGAHNMAVVRRFALGLVRAGRGRVSIKSARKLAGWDPNFLRALLLNPIQHR